MKEPQESTRSSWRYTKMTEIHPTASFNWVRLLTMSKHPIPIQTDRFRRTVPEQYTRNKKMKEPQELTRNSWRKQTKTMTKIHPTASLDWERLLTMSKHPNQIQTHQFCACHCSSTEHTEQQTDKRTTRIDTRLMVTVQSKPKKPTERQ